MPEIDFTTFIKGVGTDFKTSIDDLISIILSLKDDVEKLKDNSAPK